MSWSALHVLQWTNGSKALLRCKVACTLFLLRRCCPVAEHEFCFDFLTDPTRNWLWIPMVKLLLFSLLVTSLLNRLVDCNPCGSVDCDLFSPSLMIFCAPSLLVLASFSTLFPAVMQVSRWPPSAPPRFLLQGLVITMMDELMSSTQTQRQHQYYSCCCRACLRNFCSHKRRRRKEGFSPSLKGKDDLAVPTWRALCGESKLNVSIPCCFVHAKIQIN